MKRPHQGCRPRPLNNAPQPPELQRIESRNDQVTFRHQHPLHFAQHLVRVRGEFQRMRQQAHIHAIGGDAADCSGSHCRCTAPSGRARQRGGIRLARRKSSSGRPIWIALKPKRSATTPIEVRELPFEHIAARAATRTIRGARRGILHGGDATTMDGYDRIHSGDRSAPAPSRTTTSGALREPMNPRRRGRPRRCATGSGVSSAERLATRRDSRHPSPSATMSAASAHWSPHSRCPCTRLATNRIDGVTNGRRSRHRGLPRLGLGFQVIRDPRTYADAHSLIMGQTCSSVATRCSPAAAADSSKGRPRRCSVPHELAGAPRRHPSVLRPRIHPGQPAFRAAPWTRVIRCCVVLGTGGARSGGRDAADAAFSARPREGGQSLPALRRAVMRLSAAASGTGPAGPVPTRWKCP